MFHRWLGRKISRAKELHFQLGRHRILPYTLRITIQLIDLQEIPPSPLVSSPVSWDPISASGATSQLAAVQCPHSLAPESSQSCLQTGGRCWESRTEQMPWMRESSRRWQRVEDWQWGPPAGRRAYVLAGAAAAAAAEAAGEEMWGRVWLFMSQQRLSQPREQLHLPLGLSRFF